MSETTFKNSKPQRKYRERSQPFKRKHLGLLEKHKDYKQRAVNFHTKQDKLKNLQLKAALKNKDEFNFKMIKGQIKDGKHIQPDSSDDEEGFDAKEYQKILKTQNQNLLKVQIHRNDQKFLKLQESLQYLSTEKQNTQKFFVNSEQDVHDFQLPNNPLQENTVTHQVQTLQKPGLQAQYRKLKDAETQRDKMRNYFLKLNYEKGLLSKDKKKIKKLKQGKIIKFTKERKR